MHPTYRAGLVILGVLSVADLATPLITDGTTPPMSIALMAAALGLLSLVLVALAWRGRVAAAVGLVVLRVISSLAAAPALFFDGIPTSVVVLVAAGIALTLLGVGLVLSGVRRPAAVAV